MEGSIDLVLFTLDIDFRRIRELDCLLRSPCSPLCEGLDPTLSHEGLGFFVPRHERAAATSPDLSGAPTIIAVTRSRDGDEILGIVPILVNIPQTFARE